MPRPPRLFLEGTSQHIVQRGNNRSDIFRAADDYQLFLHLIMTASQRHDVRVHAYALMTNHVHLLVTASQPGTTGAVMQAIGRTYVPYFNGRYKRTGALFEGRYRSALVQDESYLLACMRYIELNPVRAGLVSSPDSYRWSSYRAHAHGEADPAVSPHDVYKRLGHSSAARCVGWRHLCDRGLPQADLDRIRAHLAGNAVARGIPARQSL